MGLLTMSAKDKDDSTYFPVYNNYLSENFDRRVNVIIDKWEQIFLKKGQYGRTSSCPYRNKPLSPEKGGFCFI